MATAPGDMSVLTGDHGSAAARAIVTVLIEGFDRHYGLFRSTSAQAKERFDAAAWGDAQQAVQ